MSNRSLASAEIRLTLQAVISNVLNSGDATTAQVNAQVLSGQIANGIGSGQANRAWATVARDLSAEAIETLDLYQMSNIDIGAGVGKDALGQDCLFEELYAIIITHNSGAGQLQIEPGTSNPITALGSHTAASGGALNAGGVFFRAETGDAGINLGAGSKNLKLTAKNGAVNYSIFILGRHDDDESSSSSSASSSSSSSLSSSSSSVSSSSSS